MEADTIRMAEIRDNIKSGARDDMKIVALQAPVTAARPVRADLDDHIPKPCQARLFSCDLI
jgi:hypothetical protein